MRNQKYKQNDGKGINMVNANSNIAVDIEIYVHDAAQKSRLTQTDKKGHASGKKKTHNNKFRCKNSTVFV